jgi:DNA-binding LacI/PurR family transcriptional regulator
VTRRTDTIALVICEPEERFFADPFFAAMVRGISMATAEVDKNLILLIARDPVERERAERYLRRGHVDGVVLMSLHGDDPLPRQLRRAGVPTVLVGRPLGRSQVPYVDADNRGGARLAVEHLIARRRRTIAHISGPLVMCAGIDRLDGYRDALDEEPADLCVVNTCTVTAEGDSKTEDKTHEVGSEEVRRARQQCKKTYREADDASDKTQSLESAKGLGRREGSVHFSCTSFCDASSFWRCSAVRSAAFARWLSCSARIYAITLYRSSGFS